MLVRLIEAKWAAGADCDPRVIEADLPWEQILEYNAAQGFNVYTWPNHPSAETYAALPNNPRTGGKAYVKGKDCDVREWVFADMDLKDQVYASKEEFVSALLELPCLPTRIVDSGGGVHAYWKVKDLDDRAFLRLNRRIAAFLKTDTAVSTLNQLMRVPGTLNVKDPENPVLCEVVYEDEGAVYDAETLNNWLPAITPEDEEACVNHYNSAYGLDTVGVHLPDQLPQKFEQLLKRRKDINDLYTGQQKDRSAADFILGMKLFREGFTKEELLGVLSRTAKAIERSPGHRISYAMSIINKVWEDSKAEDQKVPTKEDRTKLPIRSIADIEKLKTEDGVRIHCHEMLDATERGFRRKQVLGLIGGQGNGKTTVALNMLRWFTERNVHSEYIHLYVSLEQPAKEIADRWKKMSSELKVSRPDIAWDELVYVLDNYDDDGVYRNLGLTEIEAYVKELETVSGKKVGCAVVDHIGILKQERHAAADEQTGLIGVCKKLKSFAVAADVFFIIQSQTSRAKNGSGDIELDIDAAFGCSAFESFCDFIMTTWQPLRRMYSQMDKEKHPLFAMAFKFAKVRHRNALLDRLEADTVYAMAYEVKTELLRELTSDEYKTYEFWNRQATAERKKNRRDEPSKIKEMTWTARSLSAERVTPK